ncbi:aldo-keto reductase AKR2E4-like [Achroia grisella]|uniref:aldo-keto reductase AKR2E4-like n=1 Tax=Achroia grisella TaxID=688607 RepID=UPI0027D33017|nr:aldo-keto reductase AKR2E4-like [Achroia grisella]XP_059054345.1 aldo-keto reductase AKR2E4-like [Achroia grisella]
MLAKVPTVKLSSGYKMPIIGLGTYVPNEKCHEVQQAVKWGIEAGYRHIDTAMVYRNEGQVGEGIASKIKDGLVTREELFITAKLWIDKHAENDVPYTLKQSLFYLKLTYVDLYLINWPFSVDDCQEDAGIDYIDTWRAMENVVKLGLARSIGVSNFNKEQLERLYTAAEIKPAVCQFEISPTLTQHDLVNYCKQLSIVPVAYCPLGLLSNSRKGKGKDLIKTDPKLGELAQKYGKSRVQIGLRYLIQRDITVIPKSTNKLRIQENFNLFDFELAKEDMDIVDSYNLNLRCLPGRGFSNLKNFPF